MDYRNARVVCFDLKKLGAGLRTIAMHIINDLMNSQVSHNFARGIATWCYYDEFHVLLQDELTSSYFVTIWKMLRKKGCVPSALTQNVKDLLASRQIENIFENSDFMVLLSQAQGDRQILAKQLGISPHQLSYPFPVMNMRDYLILKSIRLLRMERYMDIRKYGLQLKRKRRTHKCTI